MDDLSERFAAHGAEARPVFFEKNGEAYIPQEAGRSPWNPGATVGVAVAGLLMHAAEQVPYPCAMLPAEDPSRC